MLCTKQRLCGRHCSVTLRAPRPAPSKGQQPVCLASSSNSYAHISRAMHCLLHVSVQPADSHMRRTQLPAPLPVRSRTRWPADALERRVLNPPFSPRHTADTPPRSQTDVRSPPQRALQLVVQTGHPALRGQHSACTRPNGMLPLSGVPARRRASHARLTVLHHLASSARCGRLAAGV